MFKIKTLNKIESEGIKKFTKNYNVSSEVTNPEAILVRSSKISPEELNPNLLCIGRAGIGVNNIPVEECSRKGIVVFNTPGANANAVKELVLSALFLSARGIFEGISYSRSIKDTGAKVPQLVEANKSQFGGQEILGKKLGIIGLGAIGMMVANAAVSLGMEVEGFDPYISVGRAWELSREVKRAENLEKMLSHVDYLSLHVPLSKDTRNLIDAKKFKLMKKGAVILNFSRAELIADADLIVALNEGKIAKYITDFPNAELVVAKNAICIPHLGASTKEAEVNCAVMIAEQIMDFIENGNIKNSVNFPECSLDRQGDARLVVGNNNVPNMVGQITTILASEGLNILNMVNKSKGELAYNIIDITGKINPSLTQKIKSINGIIMDRLIT